MSAAMSRPASPLRLVVAGALIVPALTLAGTPAPAHAADCKSVKVGKKFKIKKIRKSDGIPCGDARRVTKRWVKRDYDDFNPIHVGDRRWFCSWRRRAPMSLTTGTAECDAAPGEEVRFAVRKRRKR